MSFTSKIAEQQRTVLKEGWDQALKSEPPRDPLLETKRAHHRRIAEKVRADNTETLGGWTISRILHEVGVNNAPQQLAPLAASQ